MDSGRGGAGVSPSAAVPDGFTSRPLAPGDLGAVTELIAACELHDDGIVEIDEREIAGDWARPSFDLASRSVGVFFADRLVAAASVFLGRAQGDVHPDLRGHGLGGALLRWTWEVARSDGSERVGQVVSDNRRDARELFLAHGYEVAHHSWILRIDLDGTVETPPLPRGLAIRDLVVGTDDREVFDVIETAFAEWSNMEPETYEDWHATTLGRPDIEPWQVVLVEDIERGRIVGAAYTIDYPSGDEGWIEQLAVEKAYRGRGLGRALLHESFRRYRELGRARCGLSTDSRTGALGLYEHVGMRVDRTYTRYAKLL